MLSYMDMQNAFLHGHLDEEVYMLPPPGFVKAGRDVVCRLHKSIYGLKQSPRAWFGRFSAAAREFGMRRSALDHSLFYRTDRNGLHTFLLVYVDNIIITGDDAATRLKAFLQQQFHTKDMGRLKYFLGIANHFLPLAHRVNLVSIRMRMVL